MLVEERMSHPVTTVAGDTSFQDALQMMRGKRIRRLPVVDSRGRLIGIVVEKDLLYASPSPATSLSVFEMHYLLAKLHVDEVMTSPVITIPADCPLEEAARIMLDNRIGSLPVMRGEELVGIITETDLFRIFAEALGGPDHALRVAARVPERKGMLASFTGEIARLGGNIVSLATFLGDDPAHREITVRVQDVDQKQLVDALTSVGAEILDARAADSECQPVLFGKGKGAFTQV